MLKKALFKTCKNISPTVDRVGEEFLRCVPEERHTSHHELVQDHSHGPPVHGLAVALSGEHKKKLLDTHFINK